jgi:hypothetical protein
MGDYMLTGNTLADGWRDIAVLNASDIREAIDVAEDVTGLYVSHGRGGGIKSGFHPGVTIDAASGDVTRHHERKARPQVVAGPADVMRAIAAAINGR